MNRVQKLKLNTIVSLLNRIVIIASGFILPRLILLYFGSETNGLVASIKQFLSIVTFLDLGLGSVVQASLYKPIAAGDSKQMSLVLSSAKSYFRKISYVLIVYVAGLILFYPLIIDQSLTLVSTGLLIFALAIRTFAQYYFGIINEFLLNADQRSYVQHGTEIIVVALNIVSTVFLITQGFSIQTVMLVGSIIFLIRPLYLTYYVNKHYNVSFDMEVKENPIKQKWNGVAQHIAWTVQNSTDIVILTLFSTLDNVSIYTIYNMVTQGVKVFMQSFTTGIQSFFGDLLARDEVQLLNHYFDLIEWGIHTAVIFLYGMTAVLIIPFVRIYTSGVGDLNYYAPAFAFIFVIAQGMYSIRTPYQAMIFSAGHFRETQLSSVIEVVINVVVSIILVLNFGLVGVAVGTLLSMSYRTIYLAAYLSQNILFRPIRGFIKHMGVDILTFAAMMGLGFGVMQLITIDSIITWVAVAIVLGVLFIGIILLINTLFYRVIVADMFRRVKVRFSK